MTRRKREQKEKTRAEELKNEKQKSYNEGRLDWIVNPDGRIALQDLSKIIAIWETCKKNADQFSNEELAIIAAAKNMASLMINKLRAQKIFVGDISEDYPDSPQYNQGYGSVVDYKRNEYRLDTDNDVEEGSPVMITAVGIYDTHQNKQVIYPRARPVADEEEAKTIMINTAKSFINAMIAVAEDLTN